MGKVGTEETLKKCAHYLRIIAEGGEAPTTWQHLRTLSMNGLARTVLSVGDTIEDSYKVDDTTVYRNVWVVLGFREVELDDGSVFQDVPIIQMFYTSHTNVAFDPIERDPATEEKALAGTFYVGTNDNSNFTLLDYSEGETIDYSAFTKIYHSSWASVYPAQRGVNNWKLSFARQYLNHKGTGWAQKMHKYDVLPDNAATTVGFMSYVSEEMLAVLHPIKIKTRRATYMGAGIDTTYDTFWLLSPSEMNIYDGNASADDGEPFEWYQELLGINEARADGKIERAWTDTTGRKAGLLIKYAVRAENQAPAAQGYWLRSAYVGTYSEWIVYASGYCYGYHPTTAYQLAPACAII